MLIRDEGTGERRVDFWSRVDRRSAVADIDESRYGVGVGGVRRESRRCSEWRWVGPGCCGGARSGCEAVRGGVT